MDRVRMSRSVRNLGLLVAISMSTVACSSSSSNGAEESLQFITPRPDELADAARIEVELSVPAGTQKAELQVLLDGSPIDMADFEWEDTKVTGALTGLEEGWHELEADLSASSAPLTATASFEAVSLAHADGCEILNDEECLLPFPSSEFLEQADTPTGWRVALPAVGMPASLGVPLSPAPYDSLDGFSPGTQVLMHFPGGVDLDRSDAPRLRPEVRPVDDRSLDDDSPTVLLDASTGERILHFLEHDAHASPGGGRQVLFLRPGRSLRPGHRYIVAVRDLLRVDGSAVTAEPVFAALRDSRPSSIPAVEDRRPQLEPLFETLDGAGIERTALVLAFDFVVGSDENLARDLLAMRDQSFAWLAQKEVSGEQTFTVDDVTEYDCQDGGLWKDVQGTFEVPLFLDSDPVLANRDVGFLQYGDDGLPAFEDVMRARYTVLIPCASRTAAEVVRPVIYTHGSFSDFHEVDLVVRVWRENAAVDAELDVPAYLFGSTDGFGVAALDFDGFLESFLVGGVFLDLDNVRALPDRQRQGIVNVLTLGRMMKRGMFNLDPAFHRPGGTGVFPGPEEEMFSWGVSWGGYYGLMLGAFSEDVRRVNAAVAAYNFPHQFQRDVGFDAFDPFLATAFGPDTMTHAIVISLVHEIWALADPATFSGHVTQDPLPGSVPKKVLMAVSWDDGWSPNLFSEIAARTLGIPSLVGSIQPGLVGMDDVAGPLESAYVSFGTGIDPGNPAHAPFLTPLANLSPGERACEPHMRILTPAYFRQLARFLRPDGEIVNTCVGSCDAQDPLETPLGGGACDPLTE